jgi:DNA (cytosine-5)-methyltransferase 1
MRFIDLFAGCGGLSLGLSMAGAQGLFAVERDAMAFRTFKANFIDAPRGRISRFAWPSTWLEERAWSIDEILDEHADKLSELRDLNVDLIAGGPPCQGFSFAGRRNPDDPRNQLFKRYIDFVRLVKPTAVLLENVPGMAVAHGVAKSTERRQRGDVRGSYFEALTQALDDLGYDVEGEVIDASRFGVPQKRARLIVVGLLRERVPPLAGGKRAALVFERLESQRSTFLKSLGLTCPVTARDAIGDLTLRRSDGGLWPLKVCDDPESPKGFEELAYDGRRSRSAYQRLMRSAAPIYRMDSMRLTRHSDVVRRRFWEIINYCRQGVQMSSSDRESFNLRKQRVYPMSAIEPAPTITTLPEDVVHYCDPRILTVREYARLQSFPDWFVFKGKYTTGGDRRTKECPRYTQVGNAVPPFLALAIARALQDVLSTSGQARNGLGDRISAEEAALV